MYQPMEAERLRLEGLLEGFLQIVEDKKREQQANEDARKEAAEEQELARALEAQERAAQDRQRERERAEIELREGHREIDSKWEQIDELYN